MSHSDLCNMGWGVDVGASSFHCHHIRKHIFFYTLCSQVAQYIKFEIPVLDSFVEKLKEEEEREITKLTRK